jgi:hypothetical protein
VLGVRHRAAFDLVKDFFQLGAQVDRHDRRRGFVRAQAMVVAGGGDRRPHQGTILVDTANHRPAEHQELRIVVGRIARVEQVALGGIAHRPVNVLTGTVDARKGLFVQQTDKAVLFGGVLQHRHDQLLVVAGDVSRFKEGGDFKLAGGHFVVAGFGRNP